MYTREFWKGAGERAAATIAQTLIALIGADVTGIIDVASLDWAGITATAGIAGGLSVLKSVAAGAKSGSPSIGTIEAPQDKRPLGAAEERLGG